MAFRKISMILVSVGVLVLLGAGCAHLPGLGGKEAESAPQTTDFDDIQVPGELKIEPDKSFVYSSAGFRAGILHYTGYVEINSLVDYFSTTMTQQGWRLRSTFRSPKMVLLFEKNQKAALIMIYEKMLLTHVEIWVAPMA